MVFEEVILATQKPRIVLLDAEDVEVHLPHLFGRRGSWFDGWQFKVENREEVHAENPKVVARSLLGVCSASRYVATRFLDRPNHIIKPPQWDEALMGLGLSLTSDVFWLPDNLSLFLDTCTNVPAGSGPPEEYLMGSVMLSLDTFEKVFHRDNIQILEDHEDVSDAHLYQGTLLHDFLFIFPGVRNLFIMVDDARGHISLDQLQIVGANDPASVTTREEDGLARCHAALENYLALQSDYMKIVVLERQTFEMEGLDADDELGENMWFQQWPEISFAFLKPWVQPALGIETLFAEEE